MSALIAKLEKLRRRHLVVNGDCWFSCPLSGDCCNDTRPEVCYCGADTHNAHLDEIIAEVRELVDG